ncbi:ferredoxin [Staphylococcus lutrae]|uniref:Ferredoxin n=1 Tax=Staphylococcus lutrae TaxID=155085 RepID=A0AAC9WIY5_9STAP|nr:ferredoxin [Staphylococcus lutrae]ARJ50625.1 ferredoxin [Staphylococcus lutrae]PNZ38812.1 ferredoxin [Staphylococcus lutrae]
MDCYACVDREMCISCAACGATAPHLFKYDADDVAYMCLDQNSGTCPIPEAEIDHLNDAVENCPTAAVMVSQTPFFNAQHTI